MIPAFIETADEFRSVVHLGETTETLTLEFKRDLDGYRAADGNARREGQKEFCRDVSAFANAWGGCLLIGVDEGPGQAARVAIAIRGIDDFDGRRLWMEQAIRSFLVPNALTFFIHHVLIDGDAIIAVNVPASERLVVLWDPHPGTIECFQRTNQGKERLHPDQMEAHAMNSRRVGALMLRRVQAATRPAVAGTWHIDLTSGVWALVRRNSNGLPSMERIRAHVTLGDLGEHDFMLALTLLDESNVNSRPTIRIPYGLLREAWTTVDQKIGLFLHVRVVYERSGLTLEPF